MKRTQRGGIMLMTLVVLSAVTAILAIGLADQGAKFRTRLARVEKRKARLAAETGLQYASSFLVSETTSPLNTTGEWYTLGTNGDQEFDLENSSFRIQILDAASLENLNTATQTELENLGLTTEQVDSLLDWREAGLTPRTDGAKDDYYDTLDDPYNAKLRRMDSLNEVMLIKGFDPSVLLSPPSLTTNGATTNVPLWSLTTVDSFSPSLTAAGQPKTNLNTAQAQQITGAGITPPIAQAIIAARNANGGQFTTMGQVLQVPAMTTQAAATLVDNFAVGGQPRDEGKININSATADVLALLPGMTLDIADNIVSQQSSGFQNLSELLQVSGFTLQVLQQTVDRLSISSETFLVRVEGKHGNQVYPMEAIVSLNGGTMKVIKRYEMPQQNMKTIWNWADEATSTTDVGSGQ